MNKKGNSNIPRHKRMKRDSRLQAAKHWIPKYEGENIIKGYSKHFGVNKLCAIKELEMLDYKLDPEYIKRLKESIKAHEKSEQLKSLYKKQEDILDSLIDSDETFYYIAGYTPGGVPYGITLDEAIENGLE